MEKPLGTDPAQSRDLVAQLARVRLPGVINFTQAVLYGFDELRRAIQVGETGGLLGIVSTADGKPVTIKATTGANNPTGTRARCATVA